MRDEYVGDVGDFGKYLLLNELRDIAGREIKIGINWYYNTRPATAFRYLSDNNSPQFKKINETLFAHLGNLYASRQPRLSEIEDQKIVKGCLCYREPIPYSYPRNVREGHRKQWFDESLIALNDAKIIFLDPDNGIPPDTVTMSDIDAVKYAFIDEIYGYYKSKSVILYQHENRITGFRGRFLDEIHKIKPFKDPLVIRCPRYMARNYALIAKTEKHREVFENLFIRLVTDYPFMFEPG